MRKYYVYRHFKKGTNEVFYIGIGSQKKYLRAKTRHNRNKFWTNIYNKYGFEYEILIDDLLLDEACELEEFLIKNYGRVNLGTGPLVNLTEGGEGTLGVIKSKTSIEKWKISNKGKQDGFKNVMYGKKFGKHHLAKKVINYVTNEIFESAKEVNSGMPYSTFKSKLNGRLFNDTNYIYLINYNKNFKPLIRDVEYKLIHTYTGIAYSSFKEAAKAFNIDSQQLIYSLTKSKRKRNKNFILF